MPRKKVTRLNPTKNSGNKMKKRMKHVVTSLAEVMEKDFKALPIKLPIQFRKDISELKSREVKIAAMIKKMEKQKKAAKTKLSSLSAKYKGNPTATTKKQLKALTAEHEQVNQMLTTLSYQLSQTKKQTAALSHKQAKFTALSKEILKLDKQWEKKAAGKSEKQSIKSSKKRLKKPKKISTDINETQTTHLEETAPAPEAVDFGPTIEEPQAVN